MKRIIFLLALTTLFCKANAQDSQIKIETQSSALILKAAKNGLLYQSYLGKKLDGDFGYNAL